MDQKKFWVAFSLVKGIGAVRFRALLNYFGDLESAWQASPETLKEAGLSEKIVGKIIEVRANKDPDKMIRWIDQQNIQVVTWEDETYPVLLKEIDQPPPVLYVKGKIQPENDQSAAIVGTRKVTPYGRQVTEEIADYLARNNFTIISGLARGVDGIAHQTALNAGGKTYAVLGCGVEQVYPPEHKKLAEQIIENGALISDYPPGTKPDAANFPPRNRIISGLSQITIVIEAGETSGALITATFAVEQGRDVLAVPGNVYAPQSKGTNRLIAQGAFPYTGINSLEALLKISKNIRSSQPAILPENEIEASLLKIMQNSNGMHIDEIVTSSSLSIDIISATLTMMELKGMITSTGGMTYSLREVGVSYVTDPDE
jgi:DNA processing protein